MTTKRQREIIEFIGKGCKADDYGLFLFGTGPDGEELRMIGETRGWGAIQNLFENHNEAEAFQDDLCKFMAEAIDEKVKKVLAEKKQEEETTEHRKELKKLQEEFLDVTLGPACGKPSNKKKSELIKNRIKHLKRKQK